MLLRMNVTDEGYDDHSVIIYFEVEKQIRLRYIFFRSVTDNR